MKSYLALTWKELKTQKITATLILIAVIMSTIITTVVGQSIGILQSMRIEQAASLNGNRYLCRGCKDGCLTTGCRSRYCDYRGCCGFCCCLSAGNGDPAALYCKNEHC